MNTDPKPGQRLTCLYHGAEWQTLVETRRSGGYRWRTLFVSHVGDQQIATMEWAKA